MNAIDSILLPDPLTGSPDTAVVIEVRGNGMLPLYRHGDRLVAEPQGPFHVGDRVVAVTKGKEQVGGTLAQIRPGFVTINQGGQSRKAMEMAEGEISFLGRITWASQ
jgi:phage repressor protein C with HTH and peptisase S24 domain